MSKQIFPEDRVPDLYVLLDLVKKISSGKKIIQHEDEFQTRI